MFFLVEIKLNFLGVKMVCLTFVGLLTLCRVRFNLTGFPSALGKYLGSCFFSLIFYWDLNFPVFIK